MNALLIFFAFPIAVIIISIILERVLRCPVAVAAFIFAIFIVVTFAAFDETFLIATLAYTIIAFITAVITSLFRRNNEHNLCDTLLNLIQNNMNNGNNDNDDNNEESLSEAVENLIATNNNNSNNSNNNCGCGCNRYRRRF